MMKCSEKVLKNCEVKMSCLSIKKKLYAGFGLLIILLIGFGIFSIRGLTQMNHEVDQVTNINLKQVEKVNELLFYQAGYRIHEFGAISAISFEIKTKEKKDCQEYMLLIQKLQGEIDEIIDEEHRENWEVAKKDWIQYLRISNKVQMELELAKNTEAESMMMETSRNLYTKIADDLRALALVSQEHAKDSRNHSEKVYEQIRNIGVMIVIIITFVGFYIANYISKSINRQIDALLKSAEKVATGDFRQHGEVYTQDELGMLAISHNSMVDNIKKLILQVQRIVEEVTLDSETLKMNANQSSTVTMEIAKSVTEVAASAGVQMQAVVSTTEAIEEISVSIEKTANIAVNSAKQAHIVSNMAKDGNTSIANAIEQMKVIEGAVHDSAEVIRVLSTKSNEIGEITDVISAFAEQTNLLAFNAAIEAARVGEQGKGFAVVASEVRKLAEQSRDAANKITTLISQIQNETMKAMSSMQQGIVEVKLEKDILDETGSVFGHIYSNTENVAEEVGVIAATVQKIAQGSEEIVALIQKVDEETKRVSSKTQYVAAETDKQSMAILKIADSSQSLMQMAKDLQSEIQIFKI